MDAKTRCPVCEAPLVEPVPGVGFAACHATHDLPAAQVVARVELPLLATGHVQIEGRPHDLFTEARIVAQAHDFCQRVVAAKRAELQDRAARN